VPQSELDSQRSSQWLGTLPASSLGSGFGPLGSTLPESGIGLTGAIASTMHAPEAQTCPSPHEPVHDSRHNGGAEDRSAPHSASTAIELAEKHSVSSPATLHWPFGSHGATHTPHSQLSAPQSESSSHWSSQCVCP
jgi:hypothetical protein